MVYKTFGVMSRNNKQRLQNPSRTYLNNFSWNSSHTISTSQNPMNLRSWNYPNNFSWNSSHTILTNLN